MIWTFIAAIIFMEVFLFLTMLGIFIELRRFRLLQYRWNEQQKIINKRVIKELNEHS